jgi:hypothetical protein
MLHNHHKKSQLTIIVIVAVGLLLIATFFLYSAKSVTRVKSTQEAKQVHTAQEEMKQVTTYVQSCLDATLKRGLEILGKQGGYIGNNYHTPHPKLSAFGPEGSTHLLVDGFEVRYGILRNTLQPPVYPSSRAPYGHSASPPLAIYSSGERNFPSLELETEQHSFHNHLKAYVMGNINNCLDFSAFQTQGLEVTAGEMNGTLTIGATNVIFALQYPLTVHNTQTGEQLSQSRFSSTQNIRLGMLHALMVSLITNEVNDLTHELSSYILPDDVFLEVQKDVHNQDDIILLKDGQSILNGAPYELRIGRQNRNPALRYAQPQLKPEITTNAQGTIIATFPSGTEITPSFILENILDRDPVAPFTADDPDEDEVFFSYLITNVDPHRELVSETLAVPSLQVDIQASDGELADYQRIIINKA